MGDFGHGLLVVLSIGMTAFGIYVLVRVLHFLERANQALDIYLAEKARERYRNGP